MSIFKSYPTLFKLDKTGKTRTWKLFCMRDPSEQVFVCTEHGVLDGQIVASKKQVKEGKNIGKKNETSIEQQATLVANKTFKDKIEIEGYSVERPETAPRQITELVSVKPMLAESWNPDSKVKRKVDITFPCIVQPKLDGVRCLSFFNSERNEWVNQSRELKQFYHLAHINRELQKICKDQIVFDGELYKHNTEFNHIVGIVKKLKIKEQDLLTLSTIQYHVYDCFVPSKPDLPYQDRLALLKQMVVGCSSVVLVESASCDSAAQVEEQHQTYVERDYEGIMLRNLKGVYEHSRSRHLQKYKTFSDAEFEIIGFKEGVGNDAGTVIWRCKTGAGVEFDVRPKGTVEERKALFQSGSDYMGKRLTVKFQGMSEYGCPRFPVGLAVRDYE